MNWSTQGAVWISAKFYTNRRRLTSAPKHTSLHTLDANDTHIIRINIYLYAPSPAVCRMKESTHDTRIHLYTLNLCVVGAFRPSHILPTPPFTKKKQICTIKSRIYSVCAAWKTSEITNRADSSVKLIIYVWYLYNKMCLSVYTWWVSACVYMWVRGGIKW